MKMQTAITLTKRQIANVLTEVQTARAIQIADCNFINGQRPTANALTDNPDCKSINRNRRLQMH